MDAISQSSIPGGASFHLFNSHHEGQSDPTKFDNDRSQAHEEIEYRSRAIHELISKAINYARSSATVLITGESGTGKELFARLIHKSSQRAKGRFARVNCAALSASLMESELFGHERGAFTGATERRLGRFEWARGGTLLLDEISEIPISLQAKMLRVLEENEFQRVGSNQDQIADVRIVATSNRNLAEQIENKTFREDLYYRLNVLWLDLPPLRQRPDDIPVLANHFAMQFRKDAKSDLKGFSKKALRKICEYHWPGNVRQLRNTIHAACVIAQGDHIEVDDLPEFEKAPMRKIPAWMISMTLEEIERRMILEHLDRTHGSKTLAADVLGITTRTIANKLRNYQDQGLLHLE